MQWKIMYMFIYEFHMDFSYSKTFPDFRSPVKTFSDLFDHIHTKSYDVCVLCHTYHM